MNRVFENFFKLIMLSLILVLMVGCAKRFDCRQTNCNAIKDISSSPPKQCVVDGCTLVPDFNFKHCCDQHDIAYWQGGTLALRQKADYEFRQCIKESNQFWLASLYYAGVRIGGMPIFPTPWRWGFGWYYPNYQSNAESNE